MTAVAMKRELLVTRIRDGFVARRVDVTGWTERARLRHDIAALRERAAGHGEARE